MAYDNLKTVANQVAGQTNQGLASFMPQAAPLQTDVLTKILPMGGASWKGFNPIQTPAEIQQNQQAMTDAYKDTRSQGLSSQAIGRNLANGVYEGGSNFVPQISETVQNTLNGLTQDKGLAKQSANETAIAQNAANQAARKAAKDELRKEKAQKSPFGSQTPQETRAEAMANVPSGTGNTTVDAFNAFTAIGDAPKGGEGAPFMATKAGLGVSGAANAAASVVGGLVDAGVSFDVGLGNYNDRPTAQQLNETQEAVRQGIYSGVSAIPMFGPLISAGLQLTDGLGKMLGTQMSNISKDAAEDAGISRGLNNVVATIPGLGSVLGGFTKKTDEFEVDMDKLAGVGSAYDMSTFDSAKDLSGGLFLGQRNKVNDFIAEQNRLKDTMTGISDIQRMRKEGASVAAADLAQQNKNRYAGVTGGSMAIGERGMKFPELSWSRNLLFKYKEGGKVQETKPKRRTLEELKVYADLVNPRFIQRANDPNLTGINFIDDNGNSAFGTHYMEVGDDGEGNYYVYPRIQEINGQLQFFKDWREALNTALKNKNYLLFDNLEEADDFATNYKKVYPVFQKFQKGGKLGIDTNIIVEGSYHAHKNHLDEISPELSEMTPKGIPVVAQNEDGSKTQVAEIERKELILTKELTDKIEALYKDGSEEAMIEAGMLFADELFNNTQDNTGEVLNE